MTTSAAPERATDARFSHEALLYRGLDDFLRGTGPFLRDGAARGTPTLVVVNREKIDALREVLGDDADAVWFADMEEVGTNPARIIPLWRDFLAQAAETGQTCRGIGEPIWAGRSLSELVECQRHEALLNLAFRDADSFRLLCPYDVSSLPAAVIDEAHRTHPMIVEDSVERPSTSILDLETIAAPFAWPLPEPLPPVDGLPFTAHGLKAVRQFVAGHAAAAGLGHSRCDDLVLAVNEIATNSLRYGGGSGYLRIWQEGGCLVCDVSDHGRIVDPLLGRHRPHSAESGRGIWLVNQVCELVQIRCFTASSAVRMHMRLAAPS